MAAWAELTFCLLKEESEMHGTGPAKKEDVVFFRKIGNCIALVRKQGSIDRRGILLEW